MGFRPEKWDGFHNETLRLVYVVDFCQLPSQQHPHPLCSVTQSCPILCDPMDCSTPGLPVHHQLLEFTQTHVHWVGDAIQPSHPFCPPLLLLSIFPSIRVLSNESALHIRWPKYGSSSFTGSITASNHFSPRFFQRWFCTKINKN